MKALRNLLIASSLSLALVSCSSGTAVTPVDPSTPSVDTGTLVSQIISACRQACLFQPEISFVAALVNAAAGATVAQLTEEICNAVQTVKARPGTAVTVRGIPLRGNLVRRK